MKVAVAGRRAGGSGCSLGYHAVVRIPETSSRLELVR